MFTLSFTVSHRYKHLALLQGKGFESRTRQVTFFGRPYIYFLQLNQVFGLANQNGRESTQVLRSGPFISCYVYRLFNLARKEGDISFVRSYGH